VIGSVTDKFETGAAGWIHSLLLSEEEHCPLSEDPSASLLVLRISERLGLAAEAVQDYELARDDEEDGESLKRRLEPVAVYLLGAAAFALTAIAHLTEEEDESSPTEHKDRLLEELDPQVAATIRTDYYLYDYEPGRILSLVMSFLTEACQCAIELEGVYAPSEDEELEEDPEETLVQALWGTASMAAASAEFLIIRSQE
jgi:hypothetical protein